MICGIGIFEIRCCDLSDTFGGNLLGIHIFTEHQGRQNCNLTAGIITFHIRFRIALRIAFVLRFLQNRSKVRTLFSILLKI